MTTTAVTTSTTYPRVMEERDMLLLSHDPPTPCVYKKYTPARNQLQRQQEPTS